MSFAAKEKKKKKSSKEKKEFLSPEVVVPAEQEFDNKATDVSSTEALVILFTQKKTLLEAELSKAVEDDNEEEITRLISAMESKTQHIKRLQQMELVTELPLRSSTRKHGWTIWSCKELCKLITLIIRYLLYRPLTRGFSVLFSPAECLEWNQVIIKAKSHWIDS